MKPYAAVDLHGLARVVDGGLLATSFASEASAAT